MTSHAAVGVDDDLAAGQTGIGFRATDDELTGGVHQNARVHQFVAFEFQVLVGHDRLDDLLHQYAADLVELHTIVVLSGDQDGLDAHRLAVFAVLDGHLRLGVGP